MYNDKFYEMKQSKKKKKIKKVKNYNHDEKHLYNTLERGDLQLYPYSQMKPAAKEREIPKDAAYESF